MREGSTKGSLKYKYSSYHQVSSEEDRAANFKGGNEILKRPP